jgi:hypothetical protein
MEGNSFSSIGLNFIRAAWSPLDFRCVKFGEHPAFKEFVRDEPTVAALEVGDCLRYATKFPYNDANNHRKIATQIITAPFGLSPVDFDAFIGLETYLRNLDRLPENLAVELSIDLLGSLAGLPRTCQENYTRIRSRIFRLSYVTITNLKMWNSARKSYEPLQNCGLFRIKTMSALTAPKQKVTLELHPEFARMIRETPAMAFDAELYRSESNPALRRLFLLACRDAWNQPHSVLYDADDFAMYQLGYARDRDPHRDRVCRKQRLHKLRQRLKQAEQRGWIRPYAPCGGYLFTPTQGLLKGRLALRWSRGAALRTKTSRAAALNLAADPLYQELRRLRDQHGQPLSVGCYQNLRAEFGERRLKKHLAIVLQQQRNFPHSFKKSPVAAFVARVQHNYAPPDSFIPQRLEHERRLDQIEPGLLTDKLSQTIFRSL